MVKLQLVRSEPTEGARMAESDIVGVSEIARRLGVSQQAVSAWVARGWPAGKRGAAAVKAPRAVKVPGYVTRGTFYRWPDVKRWAVETGRAKP